MNVVSVGVAEVQDDAVRADAVSFQDGEWDEAMDYAREFMARAVGDFLDMDKDPVRRYAFISKNANTETFIWHGSQRVEMTYRCPGLTAMAVVSEGVL